MTGALWATVDDLLRARGAFAAARGRLPLPALALVLAAGGLAYGASMGSFSLRAPQMLVSAVKVPLLLLVATAACLPSSFVLNTILGLRDDMAAALRGIFAAQATLAVTLAALAPLTLVVYASSRDYVFALNFNGVPFAIAAAAGHVTLRRHYAPLIAANRKHRITSAVWLVLYVFVAIQAAWVLRPFVGHPDLPTEFFRAEAWSNAYVEILNDLARLLRAWR